jgi:ribosomal protein S18 acetylase RimI-like enzyme
MSIVIEEADLAQPPTAASLVEIIDSYARGPGGQNAPLSAHARAAMADGIRSNPSAMVLLARDGDEAVGAAVCVWGFSTFAGRPMINIHDIAVLPERQGAGIGRALIEEVEKRARQRDCCKITLEVHDTNEGAKQLYRRMGFQGWDPPTWFVTRPL